MVNCFHYRFAALNDVILIMYKTVYLTYNRFNREARDFCVALARELRERNVVVTTGSSYDLFNCFRRHKTYGLALSFSFYNDRGSGAGLMLNKNCSSITRDFAYNLCNGIDAIVPEIVWRKFDFVDSYDANWYSAFNKVSAGVKAIFFLCTKNNPVEWDVYSAAREKIVKLFADEVVRCLRSNYSSENYRKRVAAAQLKLQRNF